MNIERKIGLIITMIMLGGLVTGCGNEVNENENISNEETTTLKMTDVLVESETTNIDVEETEGTSKSETTIETTLKEDITTKQEPSNIGKQDLTTTKRQEATTKQEITTTKGQEVTTKQETTTTKKQEITTIKKTEQATTAKEEETTTVVKEEETTTVKIEEPKTWFEQKGYVVTSKEMVSDLAQIKEPGHDCTGGIITFYEPQDSWYEGYKYVQWSCWHVCNTCNATMEIFDRNTGIVFDIYNQPSDEVTLEIDGKNITLYFGIGKGPVFYVELHYPEGYDYNDVMALWGSLDDIKQVENVQEKEGFYTLDELYTYDLDKVYFLSPNDK